MIFLMFSYCSPMVLLLFSYSFLHFSHDIPKVFFLSSYGFLRFSYGFASQKPPTNQPLPPGVGATPHPTPTTSKRWVRSRQPPNNFPRGDLPPGGGGQERPRIYIYICRSDFDWPCRYDMMISKLGVYC